MTRPEELDARGRRLHAALAALLVPDNAPELRLVREWLGNWSGLGLVIAGMVVVYGARLIRPGTGCCSWRTSSSAAPC